MEGNTEFKEPPQKTIKDGSGVATSQVGESSWVSRLSDEGQQEFPNMQIDISYGTHITEKDAEKMRDKFNSADVFVPEVPGYDNELLGIFRNVSMGRLTPEQFLGRTSPLFPDFQRGMAKMLYGSRKLVLFIDVPHNNPLHRSLVHAYSSNEVLTGSFSSFLDSLKINRRKIRELQTERENFLLTQFPIKMRELLAEYPQLKEKEQIRVLLQLGSVHTGIYHNLKKQGREVNREFSANPYVYDFESEVENRYGFGKDVSDELVAKVFLENMIIQQLLPKEITRTIATDKLDIFSRRVIPQFSFKEIEEIFNRLVKREDGRRIFADKFRQKGIKIPQSEEELDEFLSKPLPKPEVPEK